jgi:hypothetical protein
MAEAAISTQVADLRDARAFFISETSHQLSAHEV